MGERTKIQWCDHTFSPWWGCTKVSPGCQFCYAEALSARFGGDVWGVGKARRRTKPANWREPLRWNEAARKAGVRWRVFCASMADVFDGEVPVQWRTDLFTLIRQCQHLDFLLLTKRPENLAAMLPWMDGPPPASMPLYWHDDRRPWSNVWLGVSVEDQRRADERIPALLAVPAEVYFLSVEPQLEHVTLPAQFLALGRRALCIVGGESGTGARPFNLSWARSLVRQCANAQVPCFVKQLGARPFVLEGSVAAQEWCATGATAVMDDCGEVHARDPKGGDPAEWPADLRVRQWKEAK